MTEEFTRIAAAALALAPLAACQTPGPVRQPVQVEVEQETRAWTRTITPEHLERLEAIDQAWAGALAAGRTAGFARRIRSEGALLEPSAGQAWGAPSPGSYRCRRIRLGTQGRQRGLAASGPFFCHIGDEGEKLSLTQQTGPERPGGYLWEDGGRRMVFIGAVSRGREDVPPAYAQAPERDVVGLFERIGTFRYRLVMPRDAGVLDVIELTALPPE
jgi:hypothetical protein